MSLRRITAMMGREFKHGSRELMFVFAVVMPLFFSLVVSLLVGTLFAGHPRLGVVDLGAGSGRASALPARLATLDYVDVRAYDDDGALRADVESGVLEMGLLLQPGADETIAGGGATPEGEDAALQLYIWGESLLRHRTTLGIAIGREVMDLAGLQSPVEVEPVLLGDAVAVPWGVRLFPLLVIATIILGGTMVPAAALVQEKQQRTLRALTTSPSTYGEVMVAKGAVGALISIVMGLVILVINRALGAQPALLMGLVALGAILAAEFGLIIGSLVGDINTLFTVIKGLGILLYAPALVYLFPTIPAWVGRVFPTYYMLAPIVAVSSSNATWSEISGDVAVLAALIVAFGAAAGVLSRREGAAG